MYFTNILSFFFSQFLITTSSCTGASRKGCTRCWSLIGVVSIFGPILFLTLTVAVDERFIMDSAAQTISAVWFLLLIFSCFTLWLMKESISLHNGDVTPLQLCVLFGKYELVSLLCSEPFFGDPLIKDSSGYDSFLLAQRYVYRYIKERR